jgi:acyl-CoA thioesterase-1
MVLSTSTKGSHKHFELCKLNCFVHFAILTNMRILIFGDSISFGLYGQHGGWVERLRDSLESQQTDNYFFNLGIPGESSNELLKRFEYETRTRLCWWEKVPLVIVLAIGINDAVIEHGKDRSTVEKYLANIRQLVNLAQTYSNKLLIIGLTPVNDSHPVVNIPEATYATNRIKEFDDTLEGYCKEKSLPYVKLFNAFLNKEEELLADGLHPNKKGHDIIAEMAKPKLQEILN